MTSDKDALQQLMEAAQRLSIEQRRQLIEKLAHELEAEASVTPLALLGSWAGVSLSAKEIDEARRECWAGLGDEG